MVQDKLVVTPKGPLDVAEMIPLAHLAVVERIAMAHPVVRGMTSLALPVAVEMTRTAHLDGLGMTPMANQDAQGAAMLLALWAALARTATASLGEQVVSQSPSAASQKTSSSQM